MAKTIITPPGTVQWAQLNEPSYKYKDEGEFNVRVLFEPGEASDAFLAQLTELYEESYEIALADAQRAKPATKKVKQADPPYRPNTDRETGEELPGFVCTFRLRYRYEGKDGQSFTKRPILCDSKLQPVKNRIGSGSTVKVSFSPNQYYTGGLGAGLSLRLAGVQVLEFVGTDGTAETIGFGEEDGFVEEASAETVGAAATGDGSCATTDDESEDY